MAYPNSTKECARQPRTAYLAAILQQVSQRILDAERVMKLTNPTKKHLNFASLANMASELQQGVSQPRSIMWSASKSQVYHQSDQPTTQHFSSKPRLSSRSSPSSGLRPQSNRPFNRSPNRCGYCKNLNHATAECWRQAKLCLICGGKHHLEQCPKYDPQRRSSVGSASRQSHQSQIYTQSGSLNI